jgi:phosphatidylglycerol:prolipoprotein diacylglycerol transferase
VAGLIGARLANIATNWGYYSDHPARWIAVWQGGLASFGGIGVALPIGLYLQRRWWPASPLAAFTDALVPALIAGWALGRVLGPQFMVNGGGHLTHQWFGIHYAGQVGKRIPVPLIQGAEDAALWLILLALDHRRSRRHVGVVTGVAMIIWGIVRSTDERLLLGQESHSGSLGVQIAGIVLALGGVIVLVRQLRVGRSTPDHSVDPLAPVTPQTQ